MKANKRQCTYGVDCKYLKQKTCRYFHPAWHLRPDLKEKPCFKGRDCWHFKQGRCDYYHSPMSSSNSSFSSESVDSRRIINRASIMKGFQEARKKRQQEERLRREREEEEAQIRYFQIMRMIRMQIWLEALRQKHINKSNPQKFEWYFGKNKTFKVMDVSEEKIQELDQCVICFVSFTGENPQKDESQKWQNHQQKFEQKIESREQKPQTKETFDKKEYLQRELTELYCKHTFHKQCIKKWLQATETCPICRKDFKEHEEYNKLKEEENKPKPLNPPTRHNNFLTGSQIRSRLLSPEGFHQSNYSCLRQNQERRMPKRDSSV